MLNGRRVDDKGTTLNRLTLSEVDEELVELLVGSLVLVGLAILDALNAGDSAVIDFDVPRIKLLFPTIVLASSGDLTGWCVSSVDEGNDVGVQSVGLQYTAKNVGNASKNAERLVTVLCVLLVISLQAESRESHHNRHTKGTRRVPCPRLRPPREYQGARR